MIYCGIDPGITGAAVALNQSGNILGVWDTPTLTIEKRVKGKARMRHELNRGEMVKILRTIMVQAEHGDIRVAIEKVNAMPDQGVSSVFTFGMGFGIWLGMLTALDLSVELVHPTRWKSVTMDGMGKEKDASRIRAQQIWGSAIDLSLVKHHGRADAALIAEYRRRIG